MRDTVTKKKNNFLIYLFKKNTNILKINNFFASLKILKSCETNS